MTSDALGHLLETRPDWDDLAAEGLVMNDVKVILFFFLFFSSFYMKIHNNVTTGS